MDWWNFMTSYNLSLHEIKNTKENLLENKILFQI